MIKDYIGIVRTFNRNILFFLAATALLGFALDGGVYSVVFNLYMLRLGYGPEYIGQVNSAGLMTFALASLPAGAVAGRFAPRTLMALGLAGMIAGCILMPLAESIAPLHPGPWFIAGYIIIYLGMAFYFVPGVPFIFEISAPNERSPIFSAKAALLALSAFAGSLSGGLLPPLFAHLTAADLMQAAPYRYTLIVAGVIMAPSLLAILRTRPIRHAAADTTETPPPVALPVEATAPLQRRWRGIQASAFTLVLLLSIVRFFQVTSVGATSTFFNVYMDTQLDVPTATIGAIAATARLVGVPAALITPLLIMRWGARSTVALAGLATVLFLLPLAFSPLWTVAGAGFIGVIACSSIRYPAFLAYSVEKVPARWRGALAGAGEFAGGMSFAVMALVGGFIIAGQGFGALFLLSAGLTLCGTFLFWIWFMRPKEPTAEPESDRVAQAG